VHISLLSKSHVNGISQKINTAKTTFWRENQVIPLRIYGQVQAPELHWISSFDLKITM